MVSQAASATAVGVLEDRRFDETWSAVTIPPQPEPASVPNGVAVRTPAPVKKRTPRGLGTVIVAVVVLASAVAAYMFVTRSSAPSEEEVNAAFGTLEGYEYQSPPPQLEKRIEDFIAEQEDAEIFETLATRNLLENGQVIGVVAIGGMDPEELTDINQRDFTSELGGVGELSTEIGGLSIQKVRRAGAYVYEAIGPGVSAGVFFDEKDGMVFSVSAADDADMRSVSTQLIKRNL
jgi:hypothetical protein